MSDTPPEPPQVGPLATEAALLLDVVADRLESMKQRSTDPAGAGGQPTQRGDDGTAGAADGRCPECGSIPGAACTACPVCRFIALLRGERPEATAKLVDGALLIIRTLRSLVPEVPMPSPAGASSAAGPTGEPPPPPPPAARRGGLEHIDIL